MRINTIKPRLRTLSNRLNTTTLAGGVNRIRGSKWQQIRQSHLTANPLCVHCLVNNRYTLANEVDHIKPLWQGGQEFNPSNIQSLCTECHKAKTAQEATQRSKQFQY